MAKTEKKKAGRKPIGEKAMTDAERAKKYRDNKKRKAQASK